jgi:hypothetical protein
MAVLCTSIPQPTRLSRILGVTRLATLKPISRLPESD